MSKIMSIQVPGKVEISKQLYQDQLVISLERLKDISQEDPSDLVKFLAKNDVGLKEFLRNLEIDNPTWEQITALTLVMYKVATVDNEFRNILLAIFFDPLIARSLWSIIGVAIEKIPSLITKGYDEKTSKDWIVLLYNIFAVGLQCIPETCTSTVLPIHVLSDTVDLLSRRPLFVALNTKVVELTEYRKTIRRNYSIAHFAQNKKKKQESIQAEVPFPFGSFRQMTVLPTVNELSSESCMMQDLQIRENRIDSPYINCDHYLDIQFRLLREDFIHPLRLGLNHYRQNAQSNQNTDIHVYNRVQILEPVWLFSGIGFKIQFDMSNLTHVYWDHSKRLLYGSLLCLSSDNFQNIHFATVVDRDSRDLKRGNVIIKFEDGTNGFGIDPSTIFTIVESAAYFEACRHILLMLQNVDTDKMPFKRYLIDLKCSMEQLGYPLYLRPADNEFGRLYDKTVHFDLTTVFQSRRSIHVEVTNELSWPHHSETAFDESQLKAIKMALSKEVSLIQGPPGTGKTYVGVRIVEALLRNKANLNNKLGPILVVCFTNHALDQFLEYIKRLNIDKEEPNVVRVGGRARSEQMRECSLQQQVKNMKARRAVPRDIYKPYSTAVKRLFNIKEKIESADLKVTQRGDRLLPLHALQCYIKPEHLAQLEKLSGHYGDGKQIDIWLEIWHSPSVSTDEEMALKQVKESKESEEKKKFQEEWLANQEDDQGTKKQEEFINVDTEAVIAEDRRLLEGEDIFLIPKESSSPAKEKKKVHAPVTIEKKYKEDRFRWAVVQPQPYERRRAIRRGLNCKPMTEKEADNIKDIHMLALRDKWRLYQYWSHQLIRDNKLKTQHMAEEYLQACRDFEETKHELGLHILQSADIIGMTTTGAAKHNYILQRICPKIVVIEEAAEVLESHIVSCLSSGAQQLVLIGDHKQLRPKPNTYELSKDYKMDISLFERLVKNDFPYVTLAIQHRMRPDISKLVHPHIYEHLVDHDSVKDYPSIKGVGANLLFLNHQALEDSKKDYDQLSHSNEFEADFIVAFCRYLILQGYETSQITILTMYKGQLLKLKKKMPKDQFEGVRVAAVDDFQGEENDIILLSLVRSNQKNNVGFLKEDTRVCVSLSRAKWGLYVFGNFEMLRGQVGTPWPDIIEDVQKRGLLSSALPLCCQNHPNSKTLVRSAEDFSKVKEGGCSIPCGKRISRCGHLCKRDCHVSDQQHTEMICLEFCGRTHPRCLHVCRKRCHQCTNGCGVCSTFIERTLPCGHTVKQRCHEYTNERVQKCYFSCKTLLRCGHYCSNYCSAECIDYASCEAVVLTERLPCGHEKNILCKDFNRMNTLHSNKLLVCSNGCVA